MNLPVSISPPIAIFLLATQQCQVYSHLNKSRMLPPFFSYKSWHDLLVHRLLILATLDSYRVTDSLRYDTEGIAALTARLHERCVLWLFDGMDTGDQKLADALQGVPLNVFMSPAEALARRMNLPTR
ncbi:hypothetical protein NBRC10513v2_003375 [Rhodotorula toruloides]|uniref:Superfamily II DNA/RNA helicase, SNF2 family n=1 Tax=Rhodotorula toruloides TaxID=5286 RepID=A0A2T0A347_RHOTO|nr:superfamily II DNA/RNA helicase, SNF2 family [Rhodotorula toruloides]